MIFALDSVFGESPIMLSLAREAKWAVLEQELGSQILGTDLVKALAGTRYENEFTASR